MMNKVLRYVLLFFSVFLFSCIVDEEEPIEGNELAVGDRIPSFSVVMDNGEKISSEDLKGNISLIVFFNTACKDCQQELPIVQRFYESHAQYPLFCISREEGASSVAEYWKRAMFTMPYSAQDDRAVYELFARQVIPRVYIIDRDGFVRYIFTDTPLAAYADLVNAVTTLETGDN